jgi:hypothetical protein
MMNVQLRDIRLASRHNVWITRCITPQCSIMGKTQEVNGVVAPTPRLLEDDREGHQPLHRALTQTYSKLERQRTTTPFRVAFTTSRNLRQQEFRTQSHIGWDNFLTGQISRDWLTYVRYNEAHSKGHGKSKDWSATFIWGL